MFTWNHRVVRTDEGNTEDGKLLVLAEVCYNEDGSLMGWNEPFMCGDDLLELRRLVKHLSVAISQPILDISEFPLPTEPEPFEEYGEPNPVEIRQAVAKLIHEMRVGEHILPGSDEDDRQT